MGNSDNLYSLNMQILKSNFFVPTPSCYWTFPWAGVRRGFTVLCSVSCLTYCQDVNSEWNNKNLVRTGGDKQSVGTAEKLENASSKAYESGECTMGNISIGVLSSLLGRHWPAESGGSQRDQKHILSLGQFKEVGRLPRAPSCLSALATTPPCFSQPEISRRMTCHSWQHEWHSYWRSGWQHDSTHSAPGRGTNKLQEERKLSEWTTCRFMVWCFVFHDTSLQSSRGYLVSPTNVLTIWEHHSTKEASARFRTHTVKKKSGCINYSIFISYLEHKKGPKHC